MNGWNPKSVNKKNPQRKSLMQKARINEKEKPQHCPPFLYDIGNKLVTDQFLSVKLKAHLTNPRNKQSPQYAGFNLTDEEGLEPPDP